ncbi:type 1 fimbrial protein [Morganella morganii]|uniref:type 1 fimbrial protein n=1 Tax=Morganella morganii TaxID=582 RepID=UPI001BDA210C|nr:type 1 fimbrial protein [Morganella morganii]ELT0453593.1 type 1 fimbrial protein [Morganella morganii]MBT0336865.1 type 1 fimbrial protein [Morganella morganii subsp. morganii]
MKFKTQLLSVALIAGMSGVSLSALAAPASEVTLQGILTNTTCDVTINGGKSVLNVGVFNTKVGGADASFPAANAITPQQVDMPVSLTGCTSGETGDLIIQGITSVGNNEENVFVSQDTNTTGFMVQDGNNQIVTNGHGPVVTIGAGDTDASYTFKVGMATTNTSPTAGAYSAPILVAYIVN